MHVRLAVLLSCCVLAGLVALAQGPGASPPPGGQGAGQGPRGGGGGGGRGGGGGGRAQNPTRDTQAQQLGVGTGSISGAVTLSGAGTPVRRAQVTLSGGGRGARSAMTNERGQFSFVALPAGRFVMTVSKPGFVGIAFGAKKPGRQGTPIQLADGQTLTNVNVVLPKGSVITGVVVDEFGEPSPNTQVRAFRYVFQNGQRTLQAAGQGQSDDRGLYRIFQLQPGDYLVSAIPRNAGFADFGQQIQAQLQPLLQQLQASGGPGALVGAGGVGAVVGGGRGQLLLEQIQQLQQQLGQQPEQSTGYAPVYYPGTVAPGQASKITLDVGEEHGGVDFQLQLVPTAKVQGHVVSPDGNLPPMAQVSLQLGGQQDVPTVPGVGISMTRLNPDGTFAFQNVGPGQYVVTVRAPIRADAAGPGDAQANAGPGRGRGFAFGGRGGAITQVLWATAEVNVDGRDVPDVTLNLQPGMTISGRVTFDGTAPPTDLTTIRVNLRPLDSQLGLPGGNAAQVDASGNFAIAGVPPGRYAIGGGGGGAGRGSMMKSAIANGQDVLDFPLDVKPNQSVSGVVVTFTDRTQELSGTLQDASGRPTSDYTILLFAADNRYWTPQSRRIMSTRPGTDGTFVFRGFPPGQYRLVAVTDAEPGEWYDPSFLSQIVSASMSVTIAEGEKRTQDLRLAGGVQ